MYKLIAIDLDGTLLNSYGEVSLENKEAIKYAQDKNVEVVLTSGRMPKAILPIANEINADKYIISGNGAQVYDVRNDDIVYANYMSKEKVLEIINICDKNSMFYNVYTNNVILTKSLNYNILFYYNENKKLPDYKKININVLDNIYKYVQEYSGNDFLKITICDDNEFVFKRIMNTLKEVKDVDILEVSHMSKKMIMQGSTKHEIAYFYTEVTNQGVNKWTAIEKLIEKLNIEAEEVIAIGDNVNDENMIKNAGVGIVVENGTPDIRKIANQITDSNNDSGVAQAIYNNLRK